MLLKNLEKTDFSVNGGLPKWWNKQHDFNSEPTLTSVSRDVLIEIQISIFFACI